MAAALTRNTLGPNTQPNQISIPLQPQQQNQFPNQLKIGTSGFLSATTSNFAQAANASGKSHSALMTEFLCSPLTNPAIPSDKPSKMMLSATAKPAVAQAATHCANFTNSSTQKAQEQSIFSGSINIPNQTIGSHIQSIFSTAENGQRAARLTQQEVIALPAAAPAHNSQIYSSPVLAGHAFNSANNTNNGKTTHTARTANALSSADSPHHKTSTPNTNILFQPTVQAGQFSQQTGPQIKPTPVYHHSPTNLSGGNHADLPSDTQTATAQTQKSYGKESVQQQVDRLAEDEVNAIQMLSNMHLPCSTSTSYAPGEEEPHRMESPSSPKAHFIRQQRRALSPASVNWTAQNKKRAKTNDQLQIGHHK